MDIVANLTVLNSRKSEKGLRKLFAMFYYDGSKNVINHTCKTVSSLSDSKTGNPQKFYQRMNYQAIAYIMLIFDIFFSRRTVFRTKLKSPEIAQLDFLRFLGRIKSTDCKIRRYCSIERLLIIFYRFV